MEDDNSVNDDIVTFSDEFHSKKSRVVVAYLDVCGYKEMLESLGEERLYESLRKLFKIVETSSFIELKGKRILKCSVFTDNVVMYFEKDGRTDDVKLSMLVALVSFFQYEALHTCGMMFRGGITDGEIINEGFVFGSAFMKAYKIESSIAEWPRVLVDKSLLSYIPTDLQKTILHPCDDGNMMVNYLGSLVKFDQSRKRIILSDYRVALIKYGILSLKDEIIEMTELMDSGSMPLIRDYLHLLKKSSKINPVVEYYNKICDESDCVDLLIDNPKMDKSFIKKFESLIKEIEGYPSMNKSTIGRHLLDFLSAYDDEIRKIVKG